MRNVVLSFKNILLFLTEKKNFILPTFLIILFGMSVNNVSALSYQNNVDLSFTFSPYITLDVSGDLLIESLVPGSSSDSNIITVSASSNNIVGYDIKATVGDSTNNYTDLRISSSDSTNIFSSLGTNKATLSAFSDDTWGYSYSTDNGTTWVSGNTGSTNTGYNGLPLYTSTGVKLADTSSAGSSSIKFKIGAKASSSKVSGDYTNIINFILTSKVLTTNYTLNYLPNDGNNGQDVSNTPNPATVSSTITDDINYTLSNSTPTRSGYTFAGWCDGTVTSETCSGTTYQPGDTYIIRNTGGNSTINLNAVWERVRYAVTVSLTNPINSQMFAGLKIYELNYNGFDGIKCYDFDVIDSIGQINNASGSTTVYSPAGYLGVHYGTSTILGDWGDDSITGGVERFDIGNREACVSGTENVGYSDHLIVYIVSGDGTIVIDGIDYYD